MDPVLNAQVQSPFVRTLSSIPTKTSSYVHGIPDNVPPFSYNKIEVQPYTDNSTTKQELTHKFRIPQGGILNRAYLKIRTKNYEPSANIVEAHYAGLYLEGTNNPTVEADYTTLKGITRFPWGHNSQVGSVPSENIPFGSGGAALISYRSCVDPANGTIYGGAQDNDEYGSNLLQYDPEQRRGSVSNGWNVVNVLESMQLTSNGKVIESIPGECIPAEVVKMEPQLRDFYTKGMVGYAAGDDFAEQTAAGDERMLWDPSMCCRDISGRLATDVTFGRQKYLLQNSHVDFTVPVPLSSLRQLGKNYDTKFVEDMELSVSMKEMERGFNETTFGVNTKSHTLTLVLTYHNFHDQIYDSIRNSNFKRGVPASIYSHDWELAGKGSWVNNSTSLNIEVKSRKLVTELLIVGKQGQIPQWRTIPSLAKLKSDYTFPEYNTNYSVQLQGSGRTIVDSTARLLQGPDSADYDLDTRRLMGQGPAHGGRSNVTTATVVNNDEYGVNVSPVDVHKISGTGITQEGVDVSFGDNFCVMRFGFQTSDEYYSGGLALQTISNPTLIITPPTSTYWNDSLVEFNVYVKHALMVRIDSGTGAITRTLDV
jgi:hypothetical protein